jgi:hypothetical protein
MSGTFQLSHPGVAVLAVVLLLAATVVGKARAEFVEQSVAARGAVIWQSRRSIGVTPEQERYPVLVRKPVFSFYRVGESVNIRYDARRHVPGTVSTYGRIDNFRGVWCAPVLLAGCGVLMLFGSVSPAHVGVFVRIG